MSASDSRIRLSTIRNRFNTKRKDEVEKMDEAPNYMNVSAAIRELEKIEMVRRADGLNRLDYVLTSTQKVTLRVFGIVTRERKRYNRIIK